jgi:hypothetical protein
MTKPTVPSYLFEKPFCAEGTKTQIPANSSVHGRASLSQGFPTETQLPLTMGGVAPSRVDVNGVLWALSAFAYWQQSGGQFAWKAALNYAIPSLVFHGDKMWWCLAENGPENSAGVTEPGTNSEVWQEFLMALVGQTGAGGGGGSGGGGDITTIFGGNPVGTIIMFYGSTAPDGYLPCDGSAYNVTDYPKLYAVLGSANTPDLRGCFVRGLGGNSAALGVKQEDAGRDIRGNFIADNSQMGTEGMPPEGSHHGCFYAGEILNAYDLIGGWGAYGYKGGYLEFAASKSWGTAHTATEFRPVNKALLYCVKHD